MLWGVEFWSVKASVVVSDVPPVGIWPRGCWTGGNGRLEGRQRRCHDNAMARPPKCRRNPPQNRLNRPLGKKRGGDRGEGGDWRSLTV